MAIRLMNDIKVASEVDGTQDVVFANGDFVIAESTLEHQRQLLLNSKNSFKENPLTCVGLSEFLLDDEDTNVLKEIRAQFQDDGMTINSLDLTIDNKPVIDAYYESK